MKYRTLSEGEYMTNKGISKKYTGDLQKSNWQTTAVKR
jgi:hypothetical protein